MEELDQEQEKKHLRICIVGCAHGEIVDMYEAVEETEKELKEKVDLILCCGDFQANRNEQDLYTMEAPPKYRTMNTFHEYYSGKRIAPILTLFIGGNHEASNHLQELPYGGWVAPNIYFLGYAGCIKFGDDLTIAGLSGIFKENDYFRGRYERVPYNEKQSRSIFHVKQFDVNRLLLLPKDKQISCFLSHDWPVIAYDNGHNNNVQQLIKKKPFFEEDIKSKRLGSPILNDICFQLKPHFWFSAHLHVKWASIIHHHPPPPINPDEIDLEEDDNNNNKDEVPTVTKFLALDKIVKGRDFLQILKIPTKSDNKMLSYDKDWLSIIKGTHLITPMEFSTQQKHFSFYQNSILMEEAKKFISEKFQTKESLLIPMNFQKNTEIDEKRPPIKSLGNPQTDEFLKLLELEHLNGFTVPFQLT